MIRDSVVCREYEGVVDISYVSIESWGKDLVCYANKVGNSS